MSAPTTSYTYLHRGGQITYTQNGEKYISDKDNAIILPKGKSYSLKGDKTGIFPIVNFDCVGFSKSSSALPQQNTAMLIRFCKIKKELPVMDNSLNFIFF